MSKNFKTVFLSYQCNAKLVVLKNTVTISDPIFAAQSNQTTKIQPPTDCKSEGMFYVPPNQATFTETDGYVCMSTLKRNWSGQEQGAKFIFQHKCFLHTQT